MGIKQLIKRVYVFFKKSPGCSYHASQKRGIDEHSDKGARASNTCPTNYKQVPFQVA
jgi:hypothetical protein